jgi:hypothetical protein
MGHWVQVPVYEAGNDEVCLSCPTCNERINHKCRPLKPTYEELVKHIEELQYRGQGADLYTRNSKILERVREGR